MPNKSKAAAPAPEPAPSPIPTEAEAEILLCWLSAKRAARQAEAIMKKLAPRVLVLARQRPGLVVDGARLTVRHSATWSYSPHLQRQMADLGILQQEERDNGVARCGSTPFVYCLDRPAYEGPAVVAKGKDSIFTRLFGWRNSKPESAA